MDILNDEHFMDEARQNAENKVLLLYFAEKVRMPVSSLQLTRVMLENRFMNYFHMQECLHDLTEKQYLTIEVRQSTDFYSISGAGSAILAMFESLLPAGIRNRISAGITEIRAGLMRETSVTADAELLGEFEWLVTLCITDGDSPLFETRLSVGSRDDARAICTNWRARASQLYPQLISLLLSAAYNET